MVVELPESFGAFYKHSISGSSTGYSGRKKKKREARAPFELSSVEEISFMASLPPSDLNYPSKLMPGARVRLHEMEFSDRREAIICCTFKS